jgi:nucleoside-diphosphate-sugar epimerase
MPFYDVALVGGGGFVAGHLLESFKLNGQRCLVLSRIRPSSVLPENFIQLDLAQQTLAEALTQHPDVRFKTLIFNSAIKARYEKSTPEWHQQGLITAPEFMGLPSFERLITIGSSEEYGPYADASEITEDAPAKTASSYGYWKLKLLENGRRWANNTGGQHIHLRPFNIIGPGADPKMLAGAVIRALLENKEFKMTAGDQYRSFTSVSTLVNTVQALLTAASWDKYGPILNVSEPYYFKIKDLVVLLQKKINSGQVVFGAVPYRDDEVWHQNPSLNKLKQLLGDNYYAPIEKTLDEMIASIRSGAQPS